MTNTTNINNTIEFPGFTLCLGMSGPAVSTFQTWLNRVRANFPAIPEITAIGIYGPQTEAAVHAFQSIRDLGTVTPSGNVDSTTWRNISRACSFATYTEHYHHYPH
jgi:peptidoglycan hydrolase-like protein with peptidoglycan-binding domain